MGTKAKSIRLATVAVLQQVANSLRGSMFNQIKEIRLLVFFPIVRENYPNVKCNKRDGRNTNTSGDTNITFGYFLIWLLFTYWPRSPRFPYSKLVAFFLCRTAGHGEISRHFYDTRAARYRIVSRSAHVAAFLLEVIFHHVVIGSTPHSPAKHI